MYEACSTANSVLETDLEIAARKGIVQELRVIETREGFFIIVSFSDKQRVMEKLKNEGLPEWFYVLAQLLAEPGKLWYLTTRRERNRPRLFKDMNRLNEHLKDAYQIDRYTVIRCLDPKASAEVFGERKSALTETTTA